MGGEIIIIWVLSLACTAVAGFVVGDTIGRKLAAKAEERAIEAERRAAEAEERAAEAEERAKPAEQGDERINCETCRGGNCTVCEMEGYFTGWVPAVKTRRVEGNAK